MGRSASFGGEQKPIGKQHRGGTLGEAIDDLRSDIDDAFFALEQAPLDGLTPQPAYTQTYTDADKTHDVDGSTDVAAADADLVAAADAVAGTGADGTSPSGAEWSAGVTLMNELKADYNAAVTLMNETKADFNALRATVTDLKQLVNAIIDDLQALNLAG